MRMRTLLGLLLLVAATPLLAQDRGMHITAWMSQVDIEGEDDFAEGFSTDFDEGFAFGVSVTRPVASWVSLEASAFAVDTDAQLLVDGVAPIDLGNMNLTPITLGAQLHLPQRPRFDPYVGAGLAYVRAADLTSPDLQVGGVGAVELESKVGYYVNVGIGVRLFGGLGIVVDGRYVPYKPNSRSSVTGVEQEIDLSPRILSLGLRLQF